MLWLLAGAAVFAGLWFWLRKPNKKLPYTDENEFRDFTNGLRSRGAALSEDGRTEMVEETRRLAFAGYDRLFEGALKAGKTPEFAHQAGVLDAAFCVLANDDMMRAHDGIRAVLRHETLPFNVSGQADGRSSIAEYLIWKIFPDEADLSKVMPTIDAFVAAVIQSSQNDPNPQKSIEVMLESQRFDWEKLAKLSLTATPSP